MLSHKGMLPGGLLSFSLSFFFPFVVFRARSARPPLAFNFFCCSHFGRRFGALAQAAQNHFSDALGAPCFDSAMQRS